MTASVAADAPGQTAQLLSQGVDAGLPMATGPKAEPVLGVQKEFPVADDRVPQEQERHWRRTSSRNAFARSVVKSVKTTTIDW